MELCQGLRLQNVRAPLGTLPHRKKTPPQLSWEIGASLGLGLHNSDTALEFRDGSNNALDFAMKLSHEYGYT